MSGPIFGGDAGAMNRTVDRWVADAKAKAARYQDMRAGMEQVSVTETSADGLVRS